MADSDALGSGNDAVRLVLAGNDVLKAESYSIHQAFLTQPSEFVITLGDGGLARTLAAKYPPRTAFQLYVGNVLRATGFTDGWELSDGEGATEVTIRGRDNLAQLHDAYVTAEVSFTNLTFADLVTKAVTDSGYKDFQIFYTNEANRKVTSGVNVTQTKAPRDASKDQASNGQVQRALQAKIGERWYGFVSRVLATQGFFLWCAADGSFILSEPNGNQKPVARIVRQRGATRNAVNVERAHLVNDTKNRFTEAIIYARGGGRKFGRQKSKGTFIDDEMIGFGFTRPFVAKDVNVTNADMAAFYARRKLAETRRDGWQLGYTVSGHTIPALAGGRACWAVDTIIDVQDDEFGLHESLWVESVTFRRDESGGTSTELAFMRPADLVFATGESPIE